MTALIGALNACMRWDFTAYSGALLQEGLQELQGHRVQYRAALSLPQCNSTGLPAAPLQSQGRHYMWWAAAAQHPGLAHGCSCAFQRSSGCSLSIAALSKWRRNMGCNRISRADCKAWSSSQSELAGCEGQAAQASTGIPHEMPVLLWLMPSRAPGAWPPEPGLERCFGPGAALTHSRQHDVPCRLSSLYFHYFFLPSQLLLGRDVTEAVYKE